MTPIDPPEPDSLAEALDRSLHGLFAANPALREAVERNRIGTTVDFGGGEDPGSGDPLIDIIGVLLEHAFRVSEEVDRLRGITDLDEETGP